ncbi:MAG: efflux RND transporter periplasmic adaptor subunit [Cyanobacteria bacterium REEB67]|nr:efflux RND transporter periplasmic adaptor subunit [Cyanobacteria bacterium REEB67]
MTKRLKLISLACLMPVAALSAGIKISGMQTQISPTTDGPAKSSVTEKNPGQKMSDNVVHLPAAASSNGIVLTKARRGSVEETKVFSSTVESRNPGTASVTSLVHGVVTKVLVDVGDNVRAGQIVAYINCPEISEAQSAYVERNAHKIEAQANVELVKTRLDLAKKESDRLATLLNEGIAAKKDVESAQSRDASTEAELQTSVAMLAASESQLTSAGSKLQSLGINPKSMQGNLSTELPLRAPISGLVSQKSAQPGQPVGPMSGALNPSLFTIVDLSKVWVMLEVPQSDISCIQNGATITFTSEVAPGKTFVGRVTKLGQTFDATSRTASVRTEVENPESILKPGMMVLANVNMRRSIAQTIIPSTAVQKLTNKTVVFKQLARASFKACPVAIGKTDAKNTEIIAGISPGDTVVTKGSFLLKSELMKSSIGGEE